MTALKLVRDDVITKPLRPLCKHGAAMWARVMGEYEIADSGGLELLQLACEGMDTAEQYRLQIENDGLMVRTSKAGGLRDHPLIRHRLQVLAFITRTIQRLGLDVEATKPMGRPAMKGYEG